MSGPSYTISEHCKCGSAFFLDATSHAPTWEAIYSDWLERHKPCLAPVPEDDPQPEGNVFTDSERSGMVQLPEMQVGFSREWFHDDESGRRSVAA